VQAIRQKGHKKRVPLEYGLVRVRLPGRRDVELSLVVVRGLGEEPLLLLTNVAVQPTRRSLWWVGSGYALPLLLPQLSAANAFSLSGKK